MIKDERGKDWVFFTYAKGIDELDWTRLHLSFVWSDEPEKVGDGLVQTVVLSMALWRGIRGMLYIVIRCYQATGKLAEQRNVKWHSEMLPLNFGQSSRCTASNSMSEGPEDMILEGFMAGRQASKSLKIFHRSFPVLCTFASHRLKAKWNQQICLLPCVENTAKSCKIQKPPIPRSAVKLAKHSTDMPRTWDSHRVIDLEAGGVSNHRPRGQFKWFRG